MTPCTDCGAEHAFATHAEAEKAGWFSRRHRTAHALMAARSAREAKQAAKRGRLLDAVSARAAQEHPA